MADPDYDLDPAAVQQAARQVLRGRAAPPTELALRGLSRSFRLGSVPRLAGTATEARAIEPKLRAYAGVAPIVYTDRWALEAVFKAFQRPRIVVLSTHGFFLEDQHEEPRKRCGAAARNPGHGPQAGHPVGEPAAAVRLAAGRLQPPAGRRRARTACLTGLEIVGTDLRGTELVVLSACETGLGAVRNGEGVAGLRQAFQLAGAETVVATLWQVPDKESARLMAAFFDNLAAGQGKAEALRQAQLAQIAVAAEAVRGGASVLLGGVHAHGRPWPRLAQRQADRGSRDVTAPADRKLRPNPWPEPNPRTGVVKTPSAPATPKGQGKARRTGQPGLCWLVLIVVAALVLISAGAFPTVICRYAQKIDPHRLPFHSLEGEKGSGVFFLTVGATGAILSPTNQPKKDSRPLILFLTVGATGGIA